MPNLDLKYITDENGNRVLPITHVNAVRDSSGNTLPSLMAPEKNGSGIGTCSTSSGTALEVSLTNYELVQNGFVAVTFSNDVPANATLNINSKGAKPIYYKGSAIEADVIKADDTAIFSYDGTNYVLCSSGAGGAAPVNPNETVNISLTQVGGNSADLIGATITITDDNTSDSETILTATWDGSIITIEIPMGTYYTVSVETITGYLPCTNKSYLAGYQTTRNIEFQYRTFGTFIEATDGTLYTSSNWDSNKTVNSFVIISANYKFRIAANIVNNRMVSNVGTGTGIKSYLTECENIDIALADNNGVYNTNQIITYMYSCGVSPSNTDYAAQYCKNFQFPNGVFGYLGSAGETNVLYSNLSALNQCRTACGLTTIVLGKPYSSDNFWTSSLASTSNGIYWRQVHLASDGLITLYKTADAACMVMPFGTYE